MAVDTLDVDKQAIGGPSVGSPSSGTYGEKQGLSDLKSELPQSQGMAPGGGPAGPPPMSPEPISPTPPGGGRPSLEAPGVPGVLLHPSTQPDTPVSTPLLDDPAGPGLVPDDGNFEYRLMVLDMLSEDPRVSPQTREWAQTVRAVLIGGDPAV